MRDDLILKWLYKQGFRISAQELGKTMLNKDKSNIRIEVIK